MPAYPFEECPVPRHALLLLACLLSAAPRRGPQNTAARGGDRPRRREYQSPRRLHKREVSTYTGRYYPSDSFLPGGRRPGGFFP